MSPLDSCQRQQRTLVLKNQTGGKFKTIPLLQFNLADARLQFVTFNYHF